MLGSSVVDIAIGLAFLYLLASLICTAVNELLAGAFKWRAADLAKALANLLDGKTSAPADGWAKRLLDHPLVDAMGANKSPPSYLPSRTFTTALLSLILDKSGSGATEDLHFLSGNQAFDALRDGVTKAGSPILTGALLPLIEAARHENPPPGTEVAAVKARIETWYDDAMDRVSGWYKRRTQLATFLVALLAASLLNLDTLTIARRLGTDATLRAQAAAESTAAAAHAAPPGSMVSPADAAKAARQLDQVQYPIGWAWTAPDKDGVESPQELAGRQWIPKILGILITTAALTLGAPFWFDTLSRLVSIRSSGPVPADEPAEPLTVTARLGTTPSPQ